MDKPIAGSAALSPREKEERRLRAETNGIFAPAKSGALAARRDQLVNEYVRAGLEKFDAEQEQANECGMVMR